ncbi:hypothetical protein N9F34_00245 [Alphaproteobacteria bacterium]|nr:hypothetical protein [Alphaproteobacteria bacterium]
MATDTSLHRFEISDRGVTRSVVNIVFKLYSVAFQGFDSAAKQQKDGIDVNQCALNRRGEPCIAELDHTVGNIYWFGSRPLQQSVHVNVLQLRVL